MPPSHDRRITRTDHRASPNAQIIQSTYYEEEISLVDLWLAIMRHKRLVLAVLLIALLIGLAAALLLPKSYTYRTTIEIGQYWNGHDFAEIDDPATVKSKLESAYISQITLAEAPDKPLEVKVDSPKNSPLIILESKVTEIQADRVHTIHAAIMRAIAKEHEQSLGQMRAIYESQMRAAQAEIATLEASDSEGSLPIILDKKRQIDELTARIEGMSPTHASQIATRSVKASSPGKGLILALSGFVGLFAGLFAAFIAEFRDKVIERMTEQTGESGST
ncbi:MAG: Wzz/FepE/Etk N-terminal domain-containing protein [Pseudomonadota bacterium]